MCSCVNEVVVSPAIYDLSESEGETFGGATRTRSLWSNPRQVKSSQTWTEMVHKFSAFYLKEFIGVFVIISLKHVWIFYLYDLLFYYSDMQSLNANGTFDTLILIKSEHVKIYARNLLKEF